MEMIILKNSPSIYRVDHSDRDLNPLFFVFGFIFTILGSLYAGFNYHKQESNCTAVWYGVAVGLVIKFVAAQPFIIFSIKSLMATHK